MNTKRKNLINYSFFYAFIYMTIAFYFPIIGVFFEDLGFNITQIGFLLATAPISGLLFQSFWGSIADRAKNKNIVIFMLAIINASIFLLFNFITGFAVAIVLMLLFNIFQVSMIPISESACLEFCDQERINYGSLRVIGSFTFSIASLFVGYFYEINKIYVFIIYFILSLITGIFILRAPKIEGHQHGQKKISPFSILKDKKLVYFLALGFFSHLSFSFHINFQGIYFKQIASDLSLYGISNAVLAICEIPFLFLGKKLYSKYGPEKILITASLFAAIRWLIVYSAKTPLHLILSNILQGPGYILIVYVVVYYINDSVPKTLKASGQAIHAIVAGAISKILGSIVGGIISDLTGIRALYLILGLSSLLWIIFVVSLHHISSKKKNITNT